MWVWKAIVKSAGDTYAKRICSPETSTAIAGFPYYNGNNVTAFEL
jgi:hypothetical protein